MLLIHFSSLITCHLSSVLPVNWQVTSVLSSTCSEPTYVHNSTTNSNITVAEICILKLYTCEAATRRPRMTNSDFMVYDSSVTLATHKAYLKVFIPTAIWNLQLICMWLYHFKRKIGLKILTPYITNLSVNVFKSLGKQKSCIIQAW